MKNYLIVGGVVIICILIALGIWKSMGKNEPAKIVVTSETELPVTVSPLEPTVSITKATSTEFSEIKESTKTNVGSKIKTGNAGRALIESSSAHQTLIDYNTEITISDDSKSEKKTKIALVSGAVWARLAKVFDSGEYYEVKTSNAVATVRGTSFGVWYRNGITTIVVTEGSIYLSAIDPKTGEIIPGSETVIKAGEKATVNEFGKITIYKITTTDKSEPWYIYNNPEDKTPVTITPKTTTPTPTVTIPTTVTPTTTQTVTTPTQTPFVITNIVPTTADNGAGTIVTLKGDGFQRLKSIVIGKNSITNYKIISPTNIQIMTEGLPVGTFDVYIIDLNNNFSRATSQLTITEAPVVETAPTTQIFYTAPLQ
ncbi:MAG: hypothetical protein AB201_00600 [Parcubacteria bacterium C7867-006]|nr:MAG: hypothetical protein AB201_00600 [Parcubacteria bacterium C7867-006]